MTRTLIDLEALSDLFPHRVARASELIALGLTGSAIAARCRPGGPWQRLGRGALLLADAPPTRSQRIAGALIHAGPDAVLSGWDALHRHGMFIPPAPGAVHLLVPPYRQVRAGPELVVEHPVRLPEPVLCQGFPVAPLARAAIDTARRLTSPDLARTMLTEVVRRGRVSPTRLRRELEAASTRGNALAHLVLDEVTTQTRALAEACAHQLLVGSGLPPPRWNYPVSDRDGTLLGVVDAWWDDVGLAWDLASYQFHPTPTDLAETVRRSARLTAAGIVVLHTLPVRLRQEPAVVLDELRQGHHHAAERPRPPVLRRPCP